MHQGNFLSMLCLVVLLLSLQRYGRVVVIPNSHFEIRHACFASTAAGLGASVMCFTEKLFFGRHGCLLHKEHFYLVTWYSCPLPLVSSNTQGFFFFFFRLGKKNKHTSCAITVKQFPATRSHLIINTLRSPEFSPA